MDPLVTSDRLLKAFLAVRDFLQTHITTEANLLQMPAIFITLFFAWLGARLLDPWLDRIAHNVAVDQFQEAFYVQHIVQLSLPALWVVALWVSVVIADQFNWPTHLVSIALQLAAVWLLIRFDSALIPNAAVAKAVAIIAWIIAALNVLGVLAPTIVMLQKASFTLGSGRISLLTVLEGIVTLALLLWLPAASSSDASRACRTSRPRRVYCSENCCESC